MPPSDSIQILPATKNDLPQILAFIRGLAEYEKLAHQCIATEENLRKTLFGPRPFAEVLMARLNQTPVGFALFFYNYSTFLAAPGIYLEDLFVLPEHRGKGIGKALILGVAKTAHQRGCGRLDWSVLDWNESAIGFYRGLGATVMPDWRICRMTAPEIAALVTAGI